MLGKERYIGVPDDHMSSHQAGQLLTRPR